MAQVIEKVELVLVICVRRGGPDESAKDVGAIIWAGADWQMPKCWRGAGQPFLLQGGFQTHQSLFHEKLLSKV